MAQHTTAAFQLSSRIESLHSPRDIPLHTNIVFICSCRDCVVPLTHAFQVSWLARYALHARLPGSTRLKTTQVAALAALKDRIVFGITVPALSCSNTSARSGMAPPDPPRALPLTVIRFSKLLFAARDSASSSQDYWMLLLRLLTCEAPTVVLASASGNLCMAESK